MGKCIVTKIWVEGKGVYARKGLKDRIWNEGHGVGKKEIKIGSFSFRVGKKYFLLTEGLLIFPFF
jgi:hypothetical protein